MKTEARICGLGGQGVVLAGQILGRAAAYDGKNVVQTQTYGAEARGSAARSEVIVSDDEIGYPMVRKCDVLVAMSQEAADANIRDLKENGTLIVDSTTVTQLPETKARIVRIPATHEAETSFGARLYANMIMLGALTEATGIVSNEAAQKAIEDTVAAKDAEKNKQAYRKGRDLAS